MITDLMIDLETVGRTPGCSIIALAAVPFNANTGKIYRDKAFNFHINLQSCLDLGLSKDYGTINWWNRENPKLFKQLCESKYTVQFVMQKFQQYMITLPKDVRLWGNSARFDLGILAYVFFKLKVYNLPWNTWKERDFRTIKHLDLGLANSLPFKGTKHDAIDDSCHQIEVLKHIINKYKLNIQ